MQASVQRRFRLAHDRRGFTRLEFGLLTGMLFAMVVNGIATLGGGLGSSNRPMGTPVADDGRPVVEANSAPQHAHHP
jgi:Flp pilus assembly pilin Flp